MAWWHVLVAAHHGTSAHACSTPRVIPTLTLNRTLTLTLSCVSVPPTINCDCDCDTMRRSDTVPLRSFFGEDYRVQAVVCWTQNWRAPGSVPDCPTHNSIINERTNGELRVRYQSDALPVQFTSELTLTLALSVLYVLYFLL